MAETIRDPGEALLRPGRYDIEAELARARAELRGVVAEASLPEMAYQLAVTRLQERAAADGILYPPPTYW